MKKVKRRHFRQFESLISSHEEYLFDALTEMTGDNQYFEDHFQSLLDEEFEALMEFLIRVHHHGLIGGMLVLHSHGDDEEEIA